MALPSSFDPNDPRFQLPDPSLPPVVKAPLPPVRASDGPGWGNRILLGVSIVGMLAFSPILFKLNHLGDDDVWTAKVLIPLFGFFFSLVIFAAVVGVRFVHWLAESFVDLIFGTNGGGYVEEGPLPKPNPEDDPESREHPRR